MGLILVMCGLGFYAALAVLCWTGQCHMIYIFLFGSIGTIWTCGPAIRMAYRTRTQETMNRQRNAEASAVWPSPWRQMGYILILLVGSVIAVISAPFRR